MEVNITVNSAEDEALSCILHHKCKVIKAVKCQMENFDGRFADQLEDLRRCFFPFFSEKFTGSLLGGLSLSGLRLTEVLLCREKSQRILYALLGFMAILFILWLAVVYGAAIGADLCGAGSTRARTGTNCRPRCQMPGLAPYEVRMTESVF